MLRVLRPEFTPTRETMHAGHVHRPPPCSSPPRPGSALPSEPGHLFRGYGLGAVERAVRTLYRATQKQLEEIQETNEEVLANQNILVESVRRLIDRRPATRK